MILYKKIIKKDNFGVFYSLLMVVECFEIFAAINLTIISKNYKKYI